MGKLSSSFGALTLIFNVILKADGNFNNRYMSLEQINIKAKRY